MNEYDKQADDFLKETGAKITVTFVRNGLHGFDLIDRRDIYSVTITRGSRSFTFEFGNSMNASGKWIIFDTSGSFLSNDDKEARKYKAKGIQVTRNKSFEIPSAYTILACLQKYDVGSFQNFCSDFGYSTDSVKANQIYGKVVEEFNNLKMLFSDEELEEMQEIQ